MQEGYCGSHTAMPECYSHHCNATLLKTAWQICLGPFGDHFLLIWALQMDAEGSMKPGQQLVLLNLG